MLIFAKRVRPKREVKEAAEHLVNYPIRDVTARASHRTPSNERRQSGHNQQMESDATHDA
jgi:hypothetical protein